MTQQVCETIFPTTWRLGRTSQSIWHKGFTLIDSKIWAATSDHNFALIHQQVRWLCFISKSPLQFRWLCSVAFFGAEAEGPEDEEATLPPGGALADAVLAACFAATQEQHPVCIAWPLVTRFLIPTACSREQKYY